MRDAGGRDKTISFSSLLPASSMLHPILTLDFRPSTTLCLKKSTALAWKA